MILRQYDPSQVTFAYKGVNITGYQDGTFIDAERNENSFTEHAGSLGDVTRSRILNRTGKITLTLMSQSPSNDVLDAFLAQDEQTGTNYGAIYIKDLFGNMKCHASAGWIAKQPKVERGKESGSTVWVFTCADLEIHAGGGVT